MRIGLLLLLTLCLTSAHAEDPPEFLYHWARLRSLRRVAKDNRQTTGFPLDYLTPESQLVNAYPVLAGTPGTYAWKHPVTGMAAASDEIYGGEALVKIQIKKSARVREISTHEEDEEKHKYPYAPGEAQILLHRHFSRDGKKLYFTEYILIDPKAVETYSALPEASEKELRQELIHLKDGTYRFPRSQVHYFGATREDAALSTMAFRRKAASFVRKFLSSDPRKIPKRFRPTFGTPADRCGEPYEELGGAS